MHTNILLVSLLALVAIGTVQGHTDLSGVAKQLVQERHAVSVDLTAPTYVIMNLGQSVERIASVELVLTEAAVAKLSGKLLDKYGPDVDGKKKEGANSGADAGKDVSAEPEAEVEGDKVAAEPRAPANATQANDDYPMAAVHEPFQYQKPPASENTKDTPATSVGGPVNLLQVEPQGTKDAPAEKNPHDWSRDELALDFAGAKPVFRGIETVRIQEYKFLSHVVVAIPEDMLSEGENIIRVVSKDSTGTRKVIERKVENTSEDRYILGNVVSKVGFCQTIMDGSNQVLQGAFMVPATHSVAIPSKYAPRGPFYAVYETEKK